MVCVGSISCPKKYDPEAVAARSVDGTLVASPASLRDFLSRRYWSQDSLTCGAVGGGVGGGGEESLEELAMLREVSGAGSVYARGAAMAGLLFASPAVRPLVRSAAMLDDGYEDESV